MERKISARRKSALVFLTLAISFTSATAAMADPDPVQTLLDALTQAGNGISDPVGLAQRTLLPVSNVTATGVSPTTIFVSWVNPAPSLANAWRIEMSTQQFGTYAPAASVNQCNASATNNATACTTAFETGPASDPSPRWVRIVPLIAVPSGDQPGLGGIVLLEGPPSDSDPAILSPAPPTNLKCNGGGPSSTSCYNVADVELTWQDNSDEAEFWIMRAPKSTQNCRQKPFGTKRYARVDQNETSYAEHIPDHNLTVHYKVVAVRIQPIVKLVGEVPSILTEYSYSDSDCVTVQTPAKDPPTAPSGLTGVLIPPRTVHLTWTDTQGASSSYVEEDGFFIEFGDGSSDWRSLTTTPQNPGQGAATYDDLMPSDSTRCYRVRAYRNGPAYSQFTNFVCIGSIPKPPSNLVATVVSNAQVNLAWIDHATTETEFVIERCLGTCTSSDTWSQINTVGTDVTTYADTSVFSSTTYSWRVRARNSSGISAPSNIATKTTPVAPVAAPSALVAVGTGSHEITLDWTDNSSDETGFRIEYHDPYGDWGKLIDVAANTHHFVDNDGLESNATRFYRVRARKGTSLSDPSNIAHATTLSPLAPNGAPTDVVGSAHDNVSIDLSWADRSSNEDYFRVEYFPFPNHLCPETLPNNTQFPYKTKAPRGSGPTPSDVNFRMNGLQPHTAYIFRIVAVNQDGEAKKSDPLSMSACIDTLGPPLPVWVDPGADNDVQATRCDMTLIMPRTGDRRVEKARIIVLSQIEGSLPSSKILYVDSANDATDDRFKITGDSWKINYHFRHGITYKIKATGYGVAPTEYFSADASRLGVTVAADCPLDTDWDSNNPPFGP